MTRAAPHHIALLCQVPKARERGPVKRVGNDDLDTALWLCEAGLLTRTPDPGCCYHRTPFGDMVVADCLLCIDTAVSARAVFEPRV